MLPSGLYGVLRPLDLMRLSFGDGDSPENPRGKDLITGAISLSILNEALEAQGDRVVQ